MKGMRVFFALGLLHVGVLAASAQQTLYVNASTGNDGVTKASNSAGSPWRTIGRAAWGSTDRNAPNASQAAAAGDNVLISGGTYTTSVAVNNRWQVVYNPVNNGSGSAYITFTCVGTCVLGAPNANGPIIGSEERINVKWFADVGLGHSWSITAYGSQGGTAGATHVNTTPDTGPVVCHGGSGCWVEGATIDGYQQIDYDDNWNGVRVENCTACVIRNNSIRNFRNLSNGPNGSAITMYGAPNSVVENNYATNVSIGLYFKDTGSSLPQHNIRVRYNKFDGVDQCFRWSVTAEDRNYVYQNVCANSGFGVFTTGGGLSNDWIFNNTFYNIPNAAVYPTSFGSGGRFWNNIVVNTGRVVLVEGGTMPSTAVIDFQHNVYSGYQQFYTGQDGNRTLSGFRSAYPGQEAVAPLSYDGNPLFVNAAAGDFRLCTGAGNPSPSCSGASPVLSVAVDIFDLDGDGNTSEVLRPGAFVSGSEIMGVTNGIQRPSAPTNVRIITQ